MSKKLPHKAEAQRIYVSSLFRLNLAYARTLRPDAIHILSAKYGLLDLDTEIEPYNVTLNDMPLREVKTWSLKVLEQLRERTDLKNDHFVILAGQKYRQFLVPHLGSCEIPMEGLTIGRQLQYLSERIHE